jgi:hypothetical protein
MAVKKKRYSFDFSFRDENEDVVRLYNKLALKVAQELGYLPLPGEMFTILVNKLAKHEGVSI